MKHHHGREGQDTSWFALLSIFCLFQFRTTILLQSEK